MEEYIDDYEEDFFREEGEECFDDEILATPKEEVKIKVVNSKFISSNYKYSYDPFGNNIEYVGPQSTPKTNKVEEKEINDYVLDREGKHSVYVELYKELGLDNLEEAFYTPVTKIDKKGVYGLRGNRFCRSYTGWHTEMEFIGGLFGGRDGRTFNGSDYIYSEELSKRSGYELRDLFLITDKEPDKVYAKILEVEKKIKEERERKEIEKLLDLVKFRERPYSDYLKPIEDTKIQFNFIERGVMVGERFISSNDWVFKECCELFKQGSETDDYVVMIPEDWMNMQGYEESFLNKYIRFINDIGLCKVTILGKGEFHKHRLIKPDKYNKTAILNNSYYRILISHRDHPMISYLTFILLRYLYHAEFNNLPYLALELKKADLGLSNWQIIVLVSGLAIQSGFLGLINVSDPAYRFPAIFEDKNSVDKIVKSSIKSGLVNKSFITRRIGTFELKRIQSLVENKHYKELLNFIKSLDEIKPVPKPESAFSKSKTVTVRDYRPSLLNLNFKIKP